MKGFKASLFAAVVILAWAAPVLVVLVLWQLPQQAESASSQIKHSPSISVGERTLVTRVSATAHVEYAERADVQAVREGVVTNVRVQIGDELVSGQNLYDVQGQGILVSRTSAPFYRPLVRGDSGVDVEQLNQFLSDARFASVSGQVSYTAATQAGVQALQKKVGASVDGRFDPAYVAWVPSNFTRVDGLNIATGDRITLGDIIVTSEPAARSVTFKANEEGRDLGSLRGELNIVVGDAAVRIASLSPGESELSSVLEMLQSRGVDDIGEASTGEPAEKATNTKEFQVVLETADPERYATIPGSALFVSTSELACVFTVEDDGEVVVRSLNTLPENDTEVGQVRLGAEFIGTRVIRSVDTLSRSKLDSCT
jgi:hypothetical protein